MIESVLNGKKLWHIECGHVIDVLRRIPSRAVHCVITSSPYW